MYLAAINLTSLSLCLNRPIGITDDFNKKYRPLLGEFDLGAFEHGIYWIGKYSSTWDNKHNWSGKQIPTVNDCVTILPIYIHHPVVFKEQSVRKIYVKGNSKLIIMQGNKLEVIE